MSTPRRSAVFSSGGMVQYTAGADTRLTPTNKDLADESESVISMGICPPSDREAPGLNEEVALPRSWCKCDGLIDGDTMPSKNAEAVRGESVRPTEIEHQVALGEYPTLLPRCEVGFVVLCG